MKKRKKNNKPLIILIVGLLISGSLLGFSVYKISENKEYVLKYQEQFEKDKQTEKSECEEKISSIEKSIETLENEIDAIDLEISDLQRQQSQEFRDSFGFSDRYYELDAQMDLKRKEQSKKRDEIFSMKKEITELNSTIWEIDNDFGDYGYKAPSIKGINPYVTLALGCVGCFITLIAFGFSKMFKNIMSEKSYSEYSEIDEGVLSEVDVNDGKLIKKEFYSKLEKLLLASSNSNYGVIRKLCTKNMAESYINEIELLKKHDQKLIVKNVENIGSKIVDVRKNEHNTIITIVQKIKLYEYTKDTSTNEITSGDDKERQEQAFKLVFVKEFSKTHSFKKCPNCSASIKDSTKVSCDYCGTVFDNSNYDWYLESKVIINED